MAAIVVSTVVATAALVGLGSAPASAATCAGANGVSVVVDFSAIPSSSKGEETACLVGSNGGSAFDLVEMKFHQTRAARDPGFVCRIDGLPSTDPCQQASPENAYWALFWSDGKSGKWAYATSGADGQEVPAGGSVAWVWQGSSTRKLPDTAPPVRSTASGSSSGAGSGGTGTTSKPKTTKSASPLTKPRAGSTAAATPKPKTSSPTAGATPTSKASKASGASASPTPSVSAPSAPAIGTTSPSPTPTDDTANAAAPVRARQPAEQHSGLPAWVPLLVLVVLGAGAGSALWWRRRLGA